MSYQFGTFKRLTSAVRDEVVRVYYRNHQGLRTLCGRLLKHFRSQFFIAQGCGDADMCEVTDTCAEIELNNFPGSKK